MCADGLAVSHHEIAASERRIGGRGLGSRRSLPMARRGLHQRAAQTHFGRAAPGTGAAAMASPRAFSDGRVTRDSAGNAVR
jgi:hypothetical protein